MLPLHQRPAWLRVMIVRPMRLPDRGFITTEAGRDSNGSVFTECGNRQKYGTRALRWNRTNDLPVMSRVLWPTELAMQSAHGRSRTGCARFRKPALYPLSYKGVAS